MKVCVIQTPYSADFADADANFAKELELIDALDESIDIAVMPEACDIPAFSGSKENFLGAYEKYNRVLLEKCAAAAKRCRCLLFVNALSVHPTGFRNTTYAFGRDGEVIGRYYKQHLTPRETLKLDSGYSYDPAAPTVLTVDGLRFGFLTCYDFYFYEAFSAIAREKVDFIIGCSHQRSDTPDALETMTKFLAYNCNAYVLRASVSMGADSPTGGTSMIVAPTGAILAELRNEVGLISFEVDPTEKYYKPAGFNNPPSAHWEYLERGRRPWKYRPAGPAIARYDSIMPYPRVCAHRGFNTVAPENSLPAFGAAIALGAEEIEFDLWVTADGEVVSIHDSTLDRVSDGAGKVYDHTYAELSALDFGAKFGEKFRGLKILKFEDILAKFAGQAVMNIHLKDPGRFDDAVMAKVLALIDRYDCRKHIYFMTGDDDFARRLRALASDIPLCLGSGRDKWAIVDRAIAIGCRKVQFHRDFVNDAMIRKAHEHGIRCNLFWSDDPDDARRFFAMGIDTILTNDFLSIRNVL